MDNQISLNNFFLFPSPASIHTHSRTYTQTHIARQTNKHARTYKHSNKVISPTINMLNAWKFVHLCKRYSSHDVAAWKIARMFKRFSFRHKEMILLSVTQKSILQNLYLLLGRHLYVKGIWRAFLVWPNLDILFDDAPQCRKCMQKQTSSVKLT